MDREFSTAYAEYDDRGTAFLIRATSEREKRTYWNATPTWRRVVICAASGLLACGREGRAGSRASDGGAVVGSQTIASAQPIGTAGASASSPQQVTSPPSPSSAPVWCEMPGKRGDSLPEQAHVAAYVTSLKRLLGANDRKGFADALLYPLRVNTGSGCAVEVQDPQTFATLFEHVVSPNVRYAILHARSPYPEQQSTHGVGVMLGRGDVALLERNGKVFVSLFNSDSWNIAGLPCVDEVAAPPPKWLHRAWQVRSVVKQPWYKAFPPSMFMNRRVTIDLQSGGVTLALETNPRKTEHCQILRFGSRTCDDPSGGPTDIHSAQEGGLESIVGKHAFLALQCGQGRQRHIQQIDVLSPSLIAVSSYYLLLLKPDEPADAVEHTAQPGESCGISGVTCANGSVCTAVADRPGTPRESCEHVDFAF